MRGIVLSRGVSSVIHRIAALIALAGAAIAEPGLARSPHFEVYAQAGAAEAQTILLEFERIRAYLSEQTGLALEGRPAARIIVFPSRQEYAGYELRPAADAYYVGTENRDLIVMPAGGGSEIETAAHEYVHLALHATELRLPPWLNEGLPEVFSKVRVTRPDGRSGGPVPARSRILQTHAWMPLSELLRLPADSPLREQRESVDVFYAESWALTDMLLGSPAYRPRFAEFVAAVAAGGPSDEALTKVYGRSLEEITADLRAWVRTRRITPQLLPPPAGPEAPIEVSGVSLLTWRSVLADLLMATGKLERAEEAYRQLEEESPENPDFPAALATIALQRRDWAIARQHWRTAMQLGLRDAALCYRFAVIASDAGFPGDEVRLSLQRAVALQPEFDDAHYMLGLLESNAGRYQEAVAQFGAMRVVAPARQFAYWVALADAYNQLGRREEAKAAARNARDHAANRADRTHASELFEMAETDLGVQFATDANGRSRLVTTRIPHDQQQWNPFIEPGDHIRRVEGRLLRVECGRPTRVVVETDAMLLIIRIADPSRVQMVNAPEEFTCGPQSGNTVTVVYAASADSEGILRGMEFH